jgi:hypothetical protein
MLFLQKEFVVVRFLFLFFLSLSGLISLHAQVAPADALASYVRVGQGKVMMIVPPEVEEFMDDMKSSSYTPTGFRVQLTSESGQGSQARANEVKARFMSKHKDLNSYLVWEAPNFKIRVGDYRTKFEAAMFWKQIQAEFPNSYIVEDKINPGGIRR